MTTIAVILGSTRPGRNGEAVAKWILELASARTDATFELVDIADHDLPLLDEPVPASMGQYQNEHTQRWAETVARYDGYVFVTPEYNHSTSAALKNAIDYVYAEWNNKAAGFVSYGSAGGVRAVEHLRLIAAELQIATVRAQVFLSLADDFKDYSEFTPRDQALPQVETMLDQLVSWTRALESVRAEGGPAS